MTATGARLLAWARRRALLLVSTVATAAFVAVMIAATLKVYEERRARLVAVEELAAENQAQNLAQCEGINDGNATLRFLLDGVIRGRTPTSPPLSDAARQLTIDTYRRLPQTDCTTGEKTYFDPPFPKESP